MPLIEVSEVVSRALYGTKRDWTAVAAADFREATQKDAKYARSEDRVNLEAANILRSVDRLDKSVAGAPIRLAVAR